MERNTLEVSSPTNRKDHPERSGFFLSKNFWGSSVFENCLAFLSYTTNHLGSGTRSNIVWHLSYTTLVLHASKHSGLPVLSTTGLRAREVLHRDESEKFLSQKFNNKSLVIHISYLSLYPKPIYMTNVLTLTKDLIGKKVRVIEMVDEPFPVPSGTIGTIYSVGFDVICVNWENGRNIGLIYDEDTYEILD